MLLTDAQLHEIRQIIADHHSAFVANVIHPSAVDPETLERLRSKGLINVKINSVEDAYVYGQLLAALDDPRVAKMGYEELKLYMRRNPVPLSPIEQRAVQVAQHTAAQYAVGLGRRVDLATGQSALNVDTQLQAQMRDKIRTATAESIAKRESARQLKSKLGWETKDWARDWDRIAITETQNAMQRGTADHYAKKFGGDVRVAKRSMPDCCPHCSRLYNGPDGQPRIFKLSQLERNGTNHGRKARDWLPVIPSTHCHCQCALVRIPDGWGFDEQGELVPGGEFGVDYSAKGDLELAMTEEMDLVKSVRLGHVDFQGLPIAIENAPGTTRHWKAPDGSEGDTTLLFAYGYVEDTDGIDGDALDVFLGPDPRAQMVYVVQQQNPATGIYDESKIMLGFPHEQAALAAYRFHYDRPGFDLSVDPMSLDHFKRWAYLSNKHDGNVLKKGKSATRFVIPLQKSDTPAPGLSSTGNVSAEMVETMAGHRAPGPGVGANYLFNVPKRGKPPTMKEQGWDIQPREMLDNLAQRHIQGRKNKEDYEFQEPLPEGTLAKPIVLPDGWPAMTTLADEDAIEAKKKQLVKEGLKNTAAVKNTIKMG